jgi:hypothetical protein
MYIQKKNQNHNFFNESSNFSIGRRCRENGNHPQEDLTKSGYTSVRFQIL